MSKENTTSDINLDAICSRLGQIVARHPDVKSAKIRIAKSADISVFTLNRYLIKISNQTPLIAIMKICNNEGFNINWLIHGDLYSKKATSNVMES